MKISIGIDVGISTTKIVGIREGKVIKPLRIKATDPVTSLYGAFGKYLYDNRIELSDVEQVMLTGVGAIISISLSMGSLQQRLTSFWLMVWVPSLSQSCSA